MPRPPSALRRLKGLCSGLLLVLLLTALEVPPASAQVSPTPQESWRVNGRVYATTIVGDTVYVGGTFSTATSPSGERVTRNNVAAFSKSTGELVRPFVANAGSGVRAIVYANGSLYVGGYFGRVNGVPRARLAKLNPFTGAVDTSFRADTNGSVVGLAAKGNSLYAGGAFTAVNGQTRTRLVKVDAVNGAVDRAFVASADNTVLSIAAHPLQDVVYVAGSFSTVSGSNRAGVAGVSGSTGAPAGPAFASSVRPILQIATNDDGTRLFGALGAAANNATGWTTGDGQRRWHTRVDGDVQAITHHAGAVYFGFHDGYLGDTRFRLLQTDAVTGVVDPDFRPVFDRFWGVFAIDADATGVVAGGEFTRVSGVPAEGFVRFLRAA